MTTRKEWFGVDVDGLAAVLARKGKTWAVAELVSNAWDAGAKTVEVDLTPVDKAPLALLNVVDDAPGGWTDLTESFTMFSRSRRGADAEKRGRFGLGEKLVLACCRSAHIFSTSGRVKFNADGTRTRSNEKTEVGTLFAAEVRMTRDELETVLVEVARLIPPAGVVTTFNGVPLERPEPVATFTTKLPTVLVDAEGNLRPTSRLATVEVFPAGDGGGDVLEMGVPVQACDWPWRLNVLQKIPLGLDRDSVTDAFRRALQVAALNVLADRVTPEQAVEPWVSEAISDGRATAAAVGPIIRARFGDKAVIATPGDPVANAQAEAAGAVVVHGGALPAGAWSNIRKHGTMLPTSAAYPSPKPADQTKRATCPACGQLV